MRSRTRLAVAACLLFFFRGSVLAGKPPLCAGGTFTVQGTPIVVAGSSDSDTLVLTGDVFSTAGGCPATIGTVRARKSGTRIRVRWDTCGSIPGPHKLSALIDPFTCTGVTGHVRSKGTRSRALVASRATCSTATGDTFDTVQKRIFSQHGCNVSTCHGTFAQGNLDLRYGAAYGSLIDVLADNPTARAAGKKRVVVGDAAASFLVQKLRGTQATGEGSTMPLVGSPLTAMELALLETWIGADAPQTGEVAGAPCLPVLQFEPAQPPPTPPGGYQVVLNGPTLQPGEEQEGCFWVPVPNPTDFYAGKWEFSLNPGTHHFAVYLNRISNPPVGVWLANDFGCFGEAMFGANVSGAPQAPYYVDNYPAGIARVVPAGAYLGLNAHYRNDFDVPIQMKVWTNIHPYNGTPQHIAQTLTSLDTTFDISVPAFTQKIQRGRFVNTLGVPMSFISLSGHMHKRGLRFTSWTRDGTKVYENFDWAHPIGSLFQPPLVLAPGDWIDYECLHDNGVTREVKRDGAGNPTTLLFGVTTDDEMCILPGSYYTD